MRRRRTHATRPGSRRRRSRFAGWVFAAACTGVAQGAAAEAVRFAIRAGGYLNEQGVLVKDAVVIVEAGKIAAIGPDVAPPGDCIVLDRSDAILCPGFVDPHVTLGTFQRTGEQAHAIESDADAADLFNRFHADFDRALRAGITTAIIAPASSHLVGGLTAVVKTAGNDTRRRRLGPGPMKLSLTAAAFTIRRPPTSLQGGLDELRRRIAEARQGSRSAAGRAAEAPVTSGRAGEASPFARWAAGSSAAIVDVDDAAGLSALARFAGEEKLRCVALHARFAAERLDDPASLAEPLILGPYGFDDPRRFTRTPGILHEEGLPFALTSDAPRFAPERLRVGAALAMQQGLPAEAAFAALTTTPAALAGVADRVGSLSPGKDADFIVFAGHPLHLTSAILEVFVDGERVYRHPDPHPATGEVRR